TAWEAIEYSFDGERFVEKLRFRLDGAPAAIRPRSDVVAVTVGPGEIVGRSSRFAQGVRWTPKGTQPVRGWPSGCELEAGYDWFNCKQLLTERFWTSALLQGARPARAAIVPPGVLWLQLQPGAAPSTTPGVGAQLAMAHLDRGDVVVTSESS